MSNYTIIDLRMDYKKDTGNIFVQYFNDTQCEDIVDYIQYLEEELIKVRDEKLAFKTFINTLDEYNAAMEKLQKEKRDENFSN